MLVTYVSHTKLLSLSFLLIVNKFMSNLIIFFVSPTATQPGYCGGVD